MERVTLGPYSTVDDLLDDLWQKSDAARKELDRIAPEQVPESGDLTAAQSRNISEMLFLRPEAALRLGTRVGRYKVVGTRSPGGQGFVHEVEANGRHYALKISRSVDPASVDHDRFMREMETLEELWKEGAVGVVEYVDSGVIEIPGLAIQRPFLVMELCEGSVASATFDRAVSESDGEFWRLVKDTLSALENLHGTGLLHKDIKPSNILRRRGDEAEPRYVLGDLGTAKHAEHGEASFSGVGSVRYYSPEILADESRARTESDDVWALGLSWYNLASNEAWQASSDDPSRRPDLGHLGAPLADLVAVALSPKPQDRNVVALRRQLGRLQSLDDDQTRTSSQPLDELSWEELLDKELARYTGLSERQGALVSAEFGRRIDNRADSKSLERAPATVRESVRRILCSTPELAPDWTELPTFLQAELHRRVESGAIDLTKHLHSPLAPLSRWGIPQLLIDDLGASGTAALSEPRAARLIRRSLLNLYGRAEWGGADYDEVVAQFEICVVDAAQQVKARRESRSTSYIALLPAILLEGKKAKATFLALRRSRRIAAAVRSLLPERPGGNTPIKQWSRARVAQLLLEDLEGRHIRTRAIRPIALLVPLVVAVGSALGLYRVLYPPIWLGGQLRGFLLVLFGSSAGALVLAELCRGAVALRRSLWAVAAGSLVIGLGSLQIADPSRINPDQPLDAPWYLPDVVLPHFQREALLATDPHFDPRFPLLLTGDSAPAPMGLQGATDLETATLYEQLVLLSERSEVRLDVTRWVDSARAGTSPTSLALEVDLTNTSDRVIEVNGADSGLADLTPVLLVQGQTGETPSASLAARSMSVVEPSTRWPDALPSTPLEFSCQGDCASNLTIGLLRPVAHSGGIGELTTTTPPSYRLDPGASLPDVSDTLVFAADIRNANHRILGLGLVDTTDQLVAFDPATDWYALATGDPAWLYSLPDSAVALDPAEVTGEQPVCMIEMTHTADPTTVTDFRGVVPCALPHTHQVVAVLDAERSAAPAAGSDLRRCRAALDLIAHYKNSGPNGAETQYPAAHVALVAESRADLERVWCVDVATTSTPIVGEYNEFGRGD